jgi:Spy/CpxP family protein refolding chaperone
MKKLLLIALLLTLTTGMAIAQQNGGPGSQGGGKGKAGNGQTGNFGNPVDRLTESLGLSPEQADAIALIFEENQLQREEERARAREMGEEMKATTHADILEILDYDQAIIFEEQMQEREAFRQNLEEYRGNRGMGGGSRGTGDCNG